MCCKFSKYSIISPRLRKSDQPMDSAKRVEERGGLGGGNHRTGS